MQVGVAELNEQIVTALRDLLIVRVDGSQAKLSVSGRLLSAGLKHRCQLGTAPRFTGPSADDALQAVRAWYDRFQGSLAPQTVATLGAHLHAWERFPALGTVQDTALDVEMSSGAGRPSAGLA
eukprot:4507902-Karenia_brevis.AAC.1